jgi:guanosine-3',5'-bis(diphosphate) 3'-pyrophosphohydrolase
VFTPQGEIKTVPKGATPVDFAYQVHTEVGNRCTGAKVNGQLVPLRYELKTGDIVEIITTKGHHPSKDWLNFVHTVKARAKIRQWIKAQDKARSITLGREMCEKEFRKYKLNFNALIKSGEMEKAVAYFGFKTVDDLIASVGYGKNTPLQIIRRFTPRSADEDSESILDKIISKVRKKKPKTGVLVKGLDDILIRFGKCCQPVPGDPITGYITHGFGVTVHRLNCRNALKMNPERRIDVAWNVEKTSTYPVEIQVSSTDRVGLLADLAANISKHGANILSANSRTRENKTVESQFTLAVENTDQLRQVIAAIRKVKGILVARRIDV